jgi:hypothetical protein
VGRQRTSIIRSDAWKSRTIQQAGLGGVEITPIYGRKWLDEKTIYSISLSAMMKDFDQTLKNQKK